jgi:integrase
MSLEEMRLGATKYAVPDPDFYKKMVAATYDEEEAAYDIEKKGLIIVLSLTGCHIGAVSGDKKSGRPGMSETNLVRQGADHFLIWPRPKTDKTLRAFVPRRYVEDVRAFLAMRRKHRSHYWRMVRDIGLLAGFEDVSPHTFRHQRCVVLLKSGKRVDEVCHILGCTVEVAVRNYAVEEDVEYMRDVDLGG